MSSPFAAFRFSTRTFLLAVAAIAGGIFLWHHYTAQTRSINAVVSLGGNVAKGNCLTGIGDDDQVPDDTWCLYFDGPVTDSDVNRIAMHLPGFGRVGLVFQSPSFGVGGLKTLCTAKNIYMLGIEGSQFRDEDMEVIAKCRLEALVLSHTGVTIDGLVSLRDMRTLEVLWVNGLAMNDGEVSQLRAEMPQLRKLLIDGEIRFELDPSGSSPN